MTDEYRKILQVVLPPFVQHLQGEKYLPKKFDLPARIEDYLTSLFPSKEAPVAEEPKKVQSEDPKQVPSEEPKKESKKVQSEEPVEEPKKDQLVVSERCKTVDCDGVPESGQYCPKCTKLQTPVPVEEPKKKGGRKKTIKEDELLDKATSTYKGVDDVKYILRGTVKIALGKFNKQGLFGPINGRNRKGILEAGYVERLRSEGDDKYTDLVHNLLLIKKGETYTIDESELDPSLRTYCESEGYIIEKNLAVVPIDEGRGIFINKVSEATQIVIQAIENKEKNVKEVYAVGMFVGKDGLLDDFSPEDKLLCDKYKYIVRYDKHLLIKVNKEGITVEPPPPVPSV